MHTALLLLLALLRHARATCEVQAPPGSSTDARLRNDVFCHLDPYVRPRSLSNQLINVSVNLHVKYISVHDFHNAMTVHSWVVIEWDDMFAQWKPEEYDNIYKIVVPTSSLWVPDIIIYNTDSSSKLLFQQVTCTLTYDGHVSCNPEVSATLYCSMNLVHWPHDSQNCSLFMSSWTWGYKLNLFSGNEGYTLETIFNNTSWRIVQITVNKHGFSDGTSWLQYQFVVQRHAALYVASVLIPTVVLSALTLSSWWVSRVMTRVALCCAACLGDILYLQYVGFVLPASGDSCPLIVLYYRDALLLCLISLVLCLFVHGASHSSDVAPLWVTKGATWLRSKPLINWMLTPQEPSSSLEGDTLAPRADAQCAMPWKVYAQLFDRLAFLVLLLVHLLLLLAALLP